MRGVNPRKAVTKKTIPGGGEPGDTWGKKSVPAGQAEILKLSASVSGKTLTGGKRIKTIKTQKRQCLMGPALANSGGKLKGWTICAQGGRPKKKALEKKKVREGTVKAYGNATQIKVIFLDRNS